MLGDGAGDRGARVSPNRNIAEIEPALDQLGENCASHIRLRIEHSGSPAKDKVVARAMLPEDLTCDVLHGDAHDAIGEGAPWYGWKEIKNVLQWLFQSPGEVGAA